MRPDPAARAQGEAADGGGGGGGGGRRRLVARRDLPDLPRPWLPVLGLARPGSSFRWLNASPMR